jgi:hypothetical protein
MKKHLLTSLRQSLFPLPRKKRRSQRSYRRTLSMESLESRQLLSATPLQSLSISGNTGEKPQSKVFEYAGDWWTVMPVKSGTWLFRLEDTNWTAMHQISTNKKTYADIKVVDDLAHVLLYNGTKSQLATLQYDAVSHTFVPWSQQPQVVNVPLSKGVETATLEVDSTGRMWIASDAKKTVEVRYSDGLYTNWSAPITVASGIKSDDISTIIAMPNNTIGVMWSNQATKLFGFRVHVDGAAPTEWLADERPASQSALSVGKGMADDHLNVTVTSDGTVYAAVKTSYDKSGYPKIGLLVRRPDGTWDDLYEVDNSGTRPIVVVNEAADRLIVAYTTKEGGGDIVYRESPLGNIAFGPRQVLISGKVNNVTSTKFTSTGDIVFFASSKSVLYSFDTLSLALNQPPQSNNGPEESELLDELAELDEPAPLESEGSPPADEAANQPQLELPADDLGIVSMAFQDGMFPHVSYAGTTDTKIAAKKASTNYGTSTTFDIDGSPDIAALLRWDVSLIPSDGVIVSAAIELNVTNATKHAYELYALEQAWDELSATWQQAAAGRSWSAAGANGAGDHGAHALGQLGAASEGIERIELNEAGVAAVQAWINDPQLNHGVLIKNYTNSDGVDISSREVSNAALRPKLIINYHVPTQNSPSEPPYMVDAGLDFAATLGQPVTLNGSIVAHQDEPTDLNLLTALWSKVSGPGAVTFGDATSISTNAEFSTAGDYVLRLTVSDVPFTTFDELTVSVV